MPTLDLREMEPTLQMINITAVMCFPSDKKKEPERRRYWLLKRLLGVAADQYEQLRPKSAEKGLELSERTGKWLGNAIHNLGGWPALANSTIGLGQKKSLAGEIEDRVPNGLITGWCLQKALHDNLSLMAAAQAWCSDENDIEFTKLDLKPPTYTWQHVQNRIWPRYRGAAHLWAALLGVGMLKCLKTRRRHFALDKYEPHGIDGFIQVANFAYEKGTSHFAATGPRTPLLNPSAAWKILF